MIRIEIGQEPLPAERPRFTRNGRAYYTKRHRDFRAAVQAAARAVMADAEPLIGALKVNVSLWRAIKPTSRRFGDVDNLIKALFDGMNKIVFNDDSQIVSCTVNKHYAEENPRAIIEVAEAWG